MLFKFWKRAAPSPEPASVRPAAVKPAAVKPASVKPAAVKPANANKPAKLTVAKTERMDERNISSLYTHAIIRKLTAGEQLYGPADIADYLYFVISGRMAIARADSNGCESSPEVLEAGDWVADSNLLQPQPRDSSATALENTSLMLINQAVLNKLDDRQQLYVFQQIQLANSKQLSRLKSQSYRLQQKNAQLIDALISANSNGDTRFAKMPLIHDLIAKIPRLPVSTCVLINKLMDEKTTSEMVANLITLDPALTADVLKSINSPQYHFDQKISDVKHAIVMIGHQGIYQLVMAEGIRKNLPDNTLFRSMYQHTLAISQLAFTIAQESHVGRPSEMATIGLLHEVGLIVIELIKKANPKMSSLIDPHSSAEMGALLLRSWDIPESICNCLSFQNYPHFSPPAKVPADTVVSVAIIYLAHLAHAKLEKRRSCDIPTLFFDEYLSQLNWGDRTLDDIVDNTLVPNLRKRAHALPSSLRELL